MPTDSGPHDFRPIRWWDRIHNLGRCAHCYLPRWLHPAKGWTTARPLGDTQRPTLNVYIADVPHHDPLSRKD